MARRTRKISVEASPEAKEEAQALLLHRRETRTTKGGAKGKHRHRVKLPIPDILAGAKERIAGGKGESGQESTGASEPGKRGSPGVAAPETREAPLSADRRTPLQMVEDLLRVGQMLLCGMRPKQIAERLGLTPSQVETSAAEALQYARKQAGSIKLGTMRTEMTAQLDYAISECFDNFHASRGPRTTTVVEAHAEADKEEKGKKSAKPGKVTRTTKVQTADVNYIFAANTLLQRKAKLHGLDAPPELRLVYEERQSGFKVFMDAIKKNVKDPALVRSIASDVMKGIQEKSGEDDSEGEALALG